MKQPFSAEDFFGEFPVSRETADRLRLYADLLVRWQAKINLVGPATLPDLWRRHFLDSAQLLPLIPSGPALDLGSGAGFPGMVLSILRPAEEAHLVESDGRKCAFLREVARLTGAPAVIHHCRIAALKPFPVTVVTARALASLAELLALAAPFLTSKTQCLFLKGEKLEDELTLAGKDWKMTAERIASRSDPFGVILRIGEIERGRDER